MPRLSCSLASSGFGFGCSVGPLCMSEQTARTVTRRPPLLSLFSRKRFTPAASSDAVTPAYLRTTGTGFFSTLSIGAFRAEPSMSWIAAPLARTGCIVHFLSSMPACRWVWRLVVICPGVNASSPFSPPSRTARERNLGISARNDRMDSSACRDATTAVNARIRRQSGLFLTTNCWGGTL